MGYHPEYYCPTCGGVYWVRTRKGQRAYVTPRYSNYGRGHDRSSLPAVRVYWPITHEFHRGSVGRRCADPWHKDKNWWGQPRGSIRGDGAPPEAPTGLNRHAPSEEVEAKAKVRARRHRDRQSKAKR